MNSHMLSILHTSNYCICCIGINYYTFSPQGIVNWHLLSTMHSSNSLTGCIDMNYLWCRRTRQAGSRNTQTYMRKEVCPAADIFLPFLGNPSLNYIRGWVYVPTFLATESSASDSRTGQQVKIFVLVSFHICAYLVTDGYCHLIYVICNGLQGQTLALPQYKTVYKYFLYLWVGELKPINQHFPNAQWLITRDNVLYCLK